MTVKENDTKGAISVLRTTQRACDMVADKLAKGTEPTEEEIEAVKTWTLVANTMANAFK